MGSGIQAGTNGRVAWAKTVGDYSFEFFASEIRKAPSGLHAKWGLLLNGAKLAWTVGNIDKDEDRNRLARRAFLRLPGPAKTIYQEEVLKFDVDDFCDGVWPAAIKQYEPVMLAGDPSIETGHYLQPYILDAGGTIMFGPPGHGKSYIGQLMAVSIDAASDTLWPVVQANTLFINLERPAKSISKRLGLINTILGLEYRRPLRTLNARGRTMRDVFDIVDDYVKREGIKFVFLDSISRGGAGSLSADEVANQIIDMLNNSCESWLALAHTSKAGENDSAFGSQMFNAGADVMIQLSSDTTGNKMGVSLKIVKANDIAKGEPQIMALEFDEQGLDIVRNATPKEFVDLEVSGAKTHKDKIWRVLGGGPMQTVEIAEATGIAEATCRMALNRYKQSFARDHSGNYWSRASSIPQ